MDYTKLTTGELLDLASETESIVEAGRGAYYTAPFSNETFAERLETLTALLEAA